MTLQEMTAKVFMRLNESGTAPSFWTVDDVETALNDGYQEMSDATEWYERTLTIDLLRERPYYDFRHLLPDQMLRVGATFNDQTNRWLTPCLPADLDKTVRRWDTITGEPTHMMVRGLWWVGYWPLSEADSGTLTQHYTAIPASLVAPTDTPGFPETVHEGLVDYALSELWAQDAESTKATQAWQQYLAYEQALIDFVQGRVAVPMVHGASSTPPSQGE